MIDTDDLDNMSRRDLVELLEAYNESLAEVKRLRGLLDEIDDVVYYNELLRDIMMSYTDEAYQIRGDEGGWIE
jgi:SPX domain protein involved in polyphosphate accumulation